MPSPPAAPIDRDMRIMVVDDEEDILAVTEMALNQWGYHNVDIFSDSFRALEQFKSNAFANEPHYFLVITDIRMPKMDGMKFALELLKVRKDVKIVFMSAFEANKNDRLKAVVLLTESNVEQKYLEKPFPLSQLCKIVKECVTTS